MGTFRCKKYYKHKTETWSRCKNLEEPPNWTKELAEELHKPVRRRFKKRRVVSNGVDAIWTADLVDMGKFSEWNEGIKFLLTVIDVFSLGEESLSSV